MEYTSPLNNNGTLVANITQQVAVDSDNPSLGLAVVTQNNNSLGTWEYLDPTSGTWKAIAASASLSSAVLLVPSARIRFNPLPGFYGNAILTCYVWDTTSNATNVTNSDPVSGAFSTSPFNISITVAYFDSPPFVNISTTNITVKEDSYIALFPGIQLSDVDNASLSSANIKFSCMLGGNTINLDLKNTTLQIMAPQGWMNSTVAGNLTITPLSGVAPLSQFQDYLRSVNISSGKDPPFNECTVMVTVYDGIAESNIAEVNVTFDLINDDSPKVLLPYNSTTYFEDAPPMQLFFPKLPVIIDLDIALPLYEASVLLTGQNASFEGLSLVLVNQPTLHLSSNNSGNLTISGPAPISTYQQLLGAIKYYNNNPEPQAGVREVNITVYDGMQGSDPVTISISIVLINDHLPLASVVNQTVVFKEQGVAVLVAMGISIMDTDSGMFLLNSTSVKILNPQDGSNESLYLDPTFRNTNVTVTGNNSQSLTFTSPYGGLAYPDAAAAIMAVYYINSAPHVTGMGRTVQIIVYDNLTNVGVTPAIPVNISIIYILLNTPPSVTLNATLVTYKQGSGLISLTTGAVVTDITTRGITGLNISTQGLTSQESITVNTYGSGLQVTSTGNMIIINGTAPDQIYTNILRTLMYGNTAINVSSGNRTVFVTAYGFLGAPSNTSSLTIWYMAGPPSFSSKVYNVTVIGGAPVGTVVTSVVVFHPDLPRTINVFALSNTGLQIFQVSFTGVVAVKTSVCSLWSEPYYTIALLAYDELFNLIASATLMIYQNANTMAPVFNSSNYTVVVNETSPMGTHVLTVQAMDADQGCARMVMYGMLGAPVSFAIDSTTGVITLTGALDFPSAHQYTFSVVAMDQGVPPLSSSASVLIIVGNNRDHPPMFNQSVYTSHVCENVPTGYSSILGVIATDPDIGNFGQVMYYINVTSGCAGCLSINRTTGLISTSGTIDYAATRFINATVLAMDGGGMSNSTSVVVRVFNQNDNVLFFKPMNFSNITIYENYPLHTPLPFLLSISPLAVDSNDTTSCPGRVSLTYNITHGNDEGYFMANMSTGVIVLVKTPLYEYLPDDSFILTLTVSDGIYSNSTNITVVILDYDACLPEFDRASYNVSIPENTAIGSVVLTIHASGCNQSNNTLWYSLMWTTPQHDFAIDPTSGNITVRNSLDHETLYVYSLTVLVTQPSSDMVTNDTVGVALTIVVTIVNDYPPVFRNTTYNFMINEVNQIPLLIGRVSALDADWDEGMDIQYAIRSQDPLIFSSFSINSTTGDIVAIAVFLYETRSLYSFTVEAVDGGRFTGYANVSVVILNINDNPPVISPTFVNVTLPENVAIGTLVANFTITVGYIGWNAVCNETILGSTLFVFNSTPSGGMLLVEGLLDYDQQPPVINLTILVQNRAPPYFITNATVVIYLINLNDEPAVVMATPNYLYYFEGDYSLALSLDFSINDTDGRDFTPILSGQVNFVNYNPLEPSYPFVPGNSTSPYEPLACSYQDEESKSIGCGFTVVNILTTQADLIPSIPVVNGTIILDSSKEQYSKYANRVTMLSNKNVTFALWVWYTPTKSFPQTIFAKTNSAQVVYGAACNSNGSLTFMYFSQSTSNITFPNICNMISYSWHHLAIVVINVAPNSMVEVYVDGKLQATQNITSSSDIGGWWHIGALYLTTLSRPQNYFNGRIHFFTISTSAVEEANIQCAIGCGVALVSSLNRYQTPLTYRYDYINRSLIVSGNASFGDYENFLNSLIWVQPFIPVQEPWYFLNYTVEDGSLFRGVYLHGQPFTLDIIVMANTLSNPILLLNGNYGANYTTTFTEQMGPVPIVNTSTFSLTDRDVSHLYTVTVTILGVEQLHQEILSISNVPAGIGASYDNDTNTLTLVTLNQPQPISLFERALRTITYVNTAEEITGLNRTVEFDVVDPPLYDVNAFTTIYFILVDDPPVLMVTPRLTMYTEGDGTVNLIGSTNITDIDNTTLASANITFFAPDGGYVELLNVSTTGTAITATYIPSISTLLLQGVDTLQNYAKVITSLTYDNTYLNNPIPLTRVFMISVFDGIKSSNLVNVSLNFIAVNFPPVLTLGKLDMVTFMEDISQNITLVTGSPSLTDVDNTTLASITVTLLDNPDGSLESIITGGLYSNVNITATSYGNQTVLTPTSATSGTPQNFITALKLLVYQNLALEVTGGTRSVQFVASDGLNNGDPVYINISIVLANDPPILILDTTGNGYQANYTEKDPPVNITSRYVSITDLDQVFISYINVTILNAYDTSSFSEVIGYPNTSDLISTNTTLNGNVTQYLFHFNNTSLSSAQQFLEMLTYINTKPKPTIGVRKINISVCDGSGGWSQPATTYLTVFDTNDYNPQFTNSTYYGSVYEDLPPLTPVVAVLATDLDMGTNGMVVYGIVTIQDTFVIDAMSGLISTNRSLDRETTSSYILNVSAHDLGVPQRFNYTTVYIQVLDINDNPPVISPTFVNVTLLENVAIGTVVANFTITDADIEVNAISNETLLGSTLLVFNSTPTGGMLLVEGLLDYDQRPVINLTILVQNRAPPYFITNATVVIYLINLNDEPAVVTATPNYLYYFEGVSLLPLSSQLQVSITDADGRDFTPILTGQVNFVNYNPSEPSYPFVPGNSTSPYAPLACSLQDDKHKSVGCGFGGFNDVSSYVVTSQSDLIPSIPVVNGTISLDSSKGQYSKYANQVTILSNQNVTFALWVWYTPTKSFPQTIFAKTYLAQVVYGAACNSNGSLTFMYFSQSTRNTTFPNICNMISNSWHHLAIVVINVAPNSMVEVYVDGKLQATQNITSSSDIGGWWYIGALYLTTLPRPQNYFNGRIHFFTISTLAVEEANIQCAIGCGVALVSSLNRYQTPLTYRYDYINRSLIVSGNASFGDYENFLNSLIWVQPFTPVQEPWYFLNYTVEDGSLFRGVNLHGQPFTLGIIVIANSISSPILLLNGNYGANYTTTFTEQMGPVPIVNTSTFSLTDRDVSHQYTITVTILGVEQLHQEVLSISNVPAGIGASYDNDTNTLTLVTLNQPQPISLFERALRTITYVNTAEEITGLNRTVEFDVVDPPLYDVNAFTTIYFILVDDSPVLMVTPRLTMYTEGDGTVNLIGSTNITDIDNTTLASANITFFAPDGGYVELLNVSTTGTAITATYIPSISTLLLQGVDTLQNYAKVITSLTYDNTYLNNPIPLTRVFMISVFDGIKPSNLVNVSLNFIAVNFSPVLTLGKPDIVTFMEDISQNITLVMGSPTLTDVDNTTLASITVTLLDNPDGSLESIITGGLYSNVNITATSNGTKLVLTPASATSGTPQNFITALKLLVYQNLALEVTGGTRSVQFVASDGLNNGDPVYINISIVLANDPPILILDTTGNGYQANYTEKDPPVNITSRYVSITDLDQVFISYINVTILNAYDTSSFSEVIGYPNTSDLISTNTTLNGNVTQYLFHFNNTSLSSAQQFLEMLTYINTKPKPTIGVRKINISVCDGSGGWSQPATTYLTVFDTNDYNPQFTNSTYYGSVYEDLPPLTPVVAVLATDLDMGTNGMVVYGIVTIQDTFVIDAMSGLISTNRSLDRETTSSYILNVSAHDLGVPQRFNYTTVYIQVLDINDNPPVISPTFVNVTLLENVAIGTVVANFTITDADIGVNAISNETILGSELLVFNSTSTGGMLLVEGLLDYDQRPVINLTILVQNIGPPYFITNASVVIYLINLNDEPAVVTASTTTVYYAEGDGTAPLDIEVHIVDADGRDFPSILSGILQFININKQEQSFQFAPNTNFLPHDCLQDDLVKFRGCGFLTPSVLTSAVQAVPRSVAVGGDMLVFNATGMQYAVYSNYLEKITSTAPNATFSVWLWMVPKIDNLPQTIFVRANQQGTVYVGAVCFYNGTLQLIYYTNKGQQSIMFSDVCTSIANAWHHLAIVIINTAQSPVVKVYIDGNDSGTKSIFPLTDGSAWITFGARLLALNKYTDYFNGKMYLFITSTSATEENNIQCAIGCGVSIVSSLNSYQTPLKYHYDYSTRSLSVTGAQTFSVYEDFLNSLIWTQPFAYPETKYYTIEYTVDDNSSAAAVPLTVNINVHIVNNFPPVLELNGDMSINYTAYYSEAQGPVPVINTTSLSLTDRDMVANDYTVTITLLDAQEPSGQELLYVFNVPNRMAFTNSSTTITLSGPLIISEFEAVIRTITYNNLAVIPHGHSRTVRFDIEDPPSFNISAFTTIFIIYVDDPPVLMVTPRLTLYTEGNGTVNLIGSTNITDIDNTTLASANITFFAPDGGYVELLNVSTTGTAITATYIPSISTLLLQGVDTLQNYAKVITSLTYDNTYLNNPIPLTRVFMISVFDGIKSSNLVNVSLNFIAVNFPPVLTLGKLDMVTFMEDISQNITLVMGSPTLTDVDNTTLASITVTLLDNPDGSLESIITGGLYSNVNITATSYGNQTVLTPTSATSGTPQNFITALKLLVYQNLALEVTGGTRRVKFVASDGLNNGGPVYINISIVLANDPPILILDTTGNGYQANYTEKDPPVNITSRYVSITDLDQVFISYINVTILNAYDTSSFSEVIGYPNTSDLISTNTTLNGNVTQYLFHFNNTPLLSAQQFLEMLTYINTKPKPTIGVRKINISVCDGSGGWSQPATTYLTVFDTNDYTPQFTNSPYYAQLYEDLPPLTPVVAVLATDLDMGTNGMVVYGIVTIQDTFVIDAMSGLISTNRSLDRETTSSYILNVSAHDLGVPQRFNYTTVYIQVLDINDNPPVISPTFVNVTLPENVAIGTLVANFTITDADIEVNAISNETLLGSTLLVLFSTPTGGMLLVEGLLDYDQQPVINLTILVQNTAPPYFITNATVVIYLINLNDDPAVVTASRNHIYYYEGDDSAALNIVIHIVDADGRDFTSIFSGILQFININKQEQSFQFTPNTNFLPHDCLQDDLLKFRGCGFLTPSVLTSAVQAIPRSVATGGDMLVFNATGMQYAWYTGSTQTLVTGSNITFSLWIWLIPTSNTLPQTIFVRTSPIQGPLVYIGALCHFNGTLEFLYSSQNVQRSVTFSSLCTRIANAWHHLAIVIVNTAQSPNVKVYIDGSLHASNSISVLSDTSALITVGATRLNSSALTNYFNGKMYFFTISYVAAEENNIQCAIGCGVSIVSSLNSYQTPLKYHYDYSTRSLSVSGAQTFSVYEDFLNSLIWTQPFPNPETQFYMIQYTVDNNSSTALLENAFVLTVEVVPLDMYPSVLALNGYNGVNYTALFIERAGPVPIVNRSSFSLTNKDNLPNTYTVTVTILDSPQPAGEEVLNVSSLPQGMTVAYSPHTLVLTGFFAISTFETVLKTITYNNIAITPIDFIRTLRFDVLAAARFTVTNQNIPQESNFAFATIFIIYVNYPPVLMVTPRLTLYTEGDGTVNLIGSTNITDIDNTTLASANITFFAPDGGYVELLNVNITGTAITATYIPSISTLLLQGVDTLQNYAKVITSLTYDNTYLNNPIPLTRVFMISVFDGITLSNLVNVSLNFTAVNFPPVLTLGKPDMVTFMEDITQNITLVMGSPSLTDVDNTTLASITVTLLDNPDGSLESIITGGLYSNMNITATSNGTKLVLTPASATGGTPQNFITALKLLVYQNLALEVTGGTRSIQFVASDGLNNGDPVYINISIVLANDPPILILDTTGNGYQTNYTEKGPPVNITSQYVSITDLDQVFISYINVTILNAYDTSSFSEVIGYPNTSDLISTNTTLNGNVTQYLFHFNNTPLSSAQQFLEMLTYINTKPKPTIGVRKINISVCDGSGGWSQPATTYLTVFDTNDYTPQFTNSPYYAQLYEDLPPLTPVVAVLATDLDMGTNGMVVYGIVTIQDTFVIDPMSGLISTNRSLDRETTSSYILNVTAHDLGVPPRYNYTTVYIQVLDINDNPPVISPTFVNVTLLENVAIGTVVANFTITDADIEVNAISNETLLGSTLLVLFPTPTGGMLLVEGLLDYDQRPVINLTILVQNRAPPYFITNASVVIYLINLNDEPAVVTATPNYLYYFEGDYSLALSLNFSITDSDGRDFAPISAAKVQSVSYDPNEPSFPFLPNTNSPYLPQICSLQSEQNKFLGCGFSNLVVLTSSSSSSLNEYPPGIMVIGNDTLVLDANQNQYVQYIQQLPSITTTATFALWTWIVPMGNTSQTLFAKFAATSTILAGAVCHPDGNLEFLYASNNLQKSVVFNNICTTMWNSWHHLALVINASLSPAIEVYVDGRLAAQQSISPLSDAQGRLFIGARPQMTLSKPPKDFFNGKIHFFIFSTSAMQENNIQCAIGCGMSLISSLNMYQTPLTYRYDYISRSLYVSGNASFAVYESFFESLIWVQPFTLVTRTIYTLNYTADDNSIIVPNQLQTNYAFQLTMNVILVNLGSPILNLNGIYGVNYTTTMIEHQGPVPAVNSLTLSLTDEDLIGTLYTAIVVITDPQQPIGQEILSVTGAPPQINTYYDNSTYTLTISGGPLPISLIEAVLRTITYNNTAILPTGFTRTLRFDVLDPPLQGNLAYTTIFLIYIDYPPVLMVTPILTHYTAGNGTVNLIGSTNITDIDNTTLASANITFFAPDGGYVELLNVNTTGTAITATYIPSISTLLLQGVDTLQNYAKVITSLTYGNTNQYNPTPLLRVFMINVFDGIKSSNLVNVSLNLTSLHYPIFITASTTSLVLIEGNDTLNVGQLSNVTLILGDVQAKIISLTISLDGTLASQEVLLLEDFNGRTQAVRSGAPYSTNASLSLASCQV